ncbi:MAG: hypothetical protein GEV08_07820 [Acidimicrobiia bacterium]|nr:hypothetical protein [Acidimicrobiia bacterium]
MDQGTVLADGCGPGPRQVWARRLAAMATALVVALLVSVGVARPSRERPLLSVAPPTAGAAAAVEDRLALPEAGALRQPAVVSASEDARIDAALALVSYPWQTRLAGWQISFLDSEEGYFGMTLVGDRRIEIYVRDEQSAADLAGVVAHELGHAVDVTLLCWGDRYDWLTARGHAPTAQWYVGDGASDFESGAGDFAEAFAVWQVGRPTWSRFAGQPTSADLDTVARLAHFDTPADERC